MDDCSGRGDGLATILMKGAAKRLGRKRSAFAVLGFLASGPRSGYDIKKAISRSTSYFWNESFGQIYPILQRLEAEGLIAHADTPPTGGRQSQKYAITEAGLAVLKDWLEMPASRLATRNEYLLKMFFGRHVPPSVMIDHLRDYRRELAQELAIFEDYRAGYDEAHAAGRGKPLVYLIAPLEFGIRGHRTQIAWCDDTIVALEALGEG